MNKYKNAISKVKTSNEFRNKLIESMNTRQIEINLVEDKKYIRKNKFKKALASIVEILGLLLGSGLTYAGITGNLKFGESGIEFSKKIEEYQVQENQKLEYNGNIIELKSKVCDDGFVILQFDVTLSDEMSKFSEESYGLQYVSFNDEPITEDGIEVTRLSGANYNLIIDGKNYWLKGATDSQIISNIENKNYTLYQLWFLSDTEIGNKQEFTITLNNVCLMVGDKLINFDGKFDVDLSKANAMNNSITYNPDNATIKYERLTYHIEKIIESPMQTLIKVRQTLDNTTSKNVLMSSEDDYIGDLIYEVYDQNGNQISKYDIITKYVFYYKDGSIKELDDEEEFEYDGFYKYDIEGYIAVGQNDKITNLKVDVFELNEYKGITRNIGEYNINLKNGKVSTQNKNEITKIDEDAAITWDIDKISTKEIEGFSIDIKENYEITKSYEAPNLNEISADEINEQNATIITYEVTLKDTGSYFQLILFKDKSVYNSYDNDNYIRRNSNYQPVKIKENDKYVLVLNAFTNYNNNIIKDVINTISWK